MTTEWLCASRPDVTIIFVAFFQVAQKWLKFGMSISKQPRVSILEGPGGGGVWTFKNVKNCRHVKFHQILSNLENHCKIVTSGGLARGPSIMVMMMFMIGMPTMVIVYCGW